MALTQTEINNLDVLIRKLWTDLNNGLTSAVTDRSAPNLARIRRLCKQIKDTETTINIIAKLASG